MTKQVTLKWNKRQFDIQIEDTDDVPTFKRKIADLTSVPMERQKITFKAKMLKDDFDMGAIADKSQLVLIGAAAPAIAPITSPATQQEIVFADDLTPADLHAMNPVPIGLLNLGNTCYANSVLQMLYNAAELREALELYLEKLQTNNMTLTNKQAQLTASLGLVFRAITTAKTQFNGFLPTGNVTNSEIVRRTNNVKDGSVTPLDFISCLRSVVPQFNETTEEGFGFAQQDADECLSSILEAVTQTLRDNDIIHKVQTKFLSSDQGSNTNVVDAFFGFETTSELKLSPKEIEKEKEALQQKVSEEAKKVETMNDENPDAPQMSICPPVLPTLQDEAATYSNEKLQKLTVGITSSTNYMIEGLEVAFNEEFEKNSPSLNRKATHIRKQCIQELPVNLIIRFNRFYWRQDTKKKAKIVRRVTFPITFDIYPLTGGVLQKTLELVRKEQNEIETKKLNSKLSSSKTEESKQNHNNIIQSEAQESKQDQIPIIDSNVLEYKKHLLSTGRYTLSAVVTHKGRGADAGHYIAWRKDFEKNIWYKCNDDTVTETTEAEVERLCGGGDFDTAYIVMYRRIDDLKQ